MDAVRGIWNNLITAHGVCLLLLKETLMNAKIFRLMLCVLLSLSVALLSGCDRMREMGMTDEMVTPPDTDTMPTLKVGLIHPQPNYTSFGKGAELARSEINQAGGVLSMPVEFVYREELTDTVLESSTELADSENVVAILGPLFSSHAVKVGPVATVPVLLGATGAVVTDTSDFLFLAASSNALQAKLMVDFAVNDLSAKTAAMIWQNMDVYSAGFVKAFEANFQELGGSIVASETYEKGDMMFDMQLTAIKDANPDILLLASFAPENPRIMKQAEDIGIQSTFIGSDGWDDSSMFEVLEDNTPLENSYYCTNFDPGAAEFISAYEAMFGIPADGIAATGYDAMRLLAIAIETAQSVDPIAIRDAVAAITDYQGATTISGFDARHHPIKPGGGIRIWQILDGKTQAYTTKLEADASE